MKEYDENQKKNYEENIKEMHHVLMERCQRYMNKCNEQEIIIKDNVAFKNLRQ